MIPELFLSTIMLLSPELKVRGERPLLVSFFQEECEACRRQFKEFPCLEESGFHIQVVGVGDDKLRLKKLARRLSNGSKDVSGIISWKDARELGLRGTPSAFLIRKENEIEKILGLYSCASKDKPPESQTIKTSGNARSERSPEIGRHRLFPI